MSTLSDPIDSSPPGSSIHGIFQARVLEWVATAFWRVYFHSCFKVALSITAVPPVPYLSLGSLPVLLLPCPALCFWPKLLGRCLCGSFYVLAICVGFPHLPELTLCVAGLCAFDSQFQWSTLCITGIVCTCLSSLGVHSASRGLCRLVSAPWASTLRHWASVALFRLTVPTLYVAGFMCTCFLSLPALFVAGGYLFFLRLCREGCVHCPSLYASPLSAPRSCALRGLCLRPLYYKGCVHWLGLSAAPLSVPLSAPVCLGSQSMAC